VSAFGQLVCSKLQVQLVVFWGTKVGPLKDHFAVQLDVARAKIRGGAGGQVGGRGRFDPPLQKLFDHVEVGGVGVRVRSETGSYGVHGGA